MLIYDYLFSTSVCVDTDNNIWKEGDKISVKSKSRGEWMHDGIITKVYDSGIKVFYGKEIRWTIYGGLGTTKFIEKDHIAKYIKLRKKNKDNKILLKKDKK